MSDIQELEQKNKDLHKKLHELMDKIDKSYFTVAIPTDGPTRNGRSYSRETLIKAVKEYNQQVKKVRSTLVSIKDDNDMPGTIHLDNVVAKVEEIKEVNGDIKVKIKFLDNEKSTLVKNYLKSGVKMEITARMSLSEEIVDFQIGI